MNLVILAVWLFASTCASIRIFSYSDRRFYLERSPSLRVNILIILWLRLGVAFSISSPTIPGLALKLIFLLEVVIFPILIGIDIREHKVPTLLLQIGGAIVAGALVFSKQRIAFFPIIVSTVFLVSPYLLSNLIRPNSIGAGDLRLCLLLGPLIGLLLSPGDAWGINVLAAVSSAIVVLFARIFLDLKITKVPLAPFLIGAVLLVEELQGVINVGSWLH